MIDDYYYYILIMMMDKEKKRKRKEREEEEDLDCARLMTSGQAAAILNYNSTTTHVFGARAAVTR